MSTSRADLYARWADSCADNHDRISDEFTVKWKDRQPDECWNAAFQAGYHKAYADSMRALANDMREGHLVPPETDAERRSAS